MVERIMRVAPSRRFGGEVFGKEGSPEHYRLAQPFCLWKAKPVEVALESALMSVITRGGS
ncbi:MAG: hypothetical protein AMK69_22485 [Nitrospira bacterium SG8_3]|nr:MAG: hypothetical protein AMK69_22485 [Nitrospira bacterium SG8_3]